MKFNWGTGIIIVSFLFMSFIVTLVVKTYQYKVDLVSEDYYNQELHFQEKIDKMNNITSSNKISWKIEEKEIIFQFPPDIDSNLTGTIEFFCPSDLEKDWKVPIHLDKERRQYLSKDSLLHKLYKIKIDWTSYNKGYYMEEDIFIQ